jgi:tagatose 1,6-diphosphate aldolase
MSFTIGKIRGLQQITTSAGAFTICAMDHRGSLQNLLEKEWGRKIEFQEMVEFKMELCAVMSPYASAILLDPIYGAAPGIARGVLPGNIGLLVSVEATGYEASSAGRITKLLEGWSVEKVKRMGGSAVKILVYYRSDLPDIAKQQLKTIDEVASDCIKHDLPFLVEPVAYPVKGEKADSAEFAERKPVLVIETARQITELPIDVLKSEFPADLRYEKDEGKMFDYCSELNDVSKVPWVVLSAGVDYETFRQQVKIACKAGSSGFLGGRAIWQELVKFKDRGARTNFLRTTVVDRFKELADINSAFATPWFSKLGLKKNELAVLNENWYTNY